MPASVRTAMTREITIHTPGRGLHEITGEIAAIVRDAAVDDGLCTVFVRHTSASLLIQENADPSARRDLEAWFERIAPEGDTLYTHTAEGADDMPSHVRAALTQTNVGVPITRGRLALGTWQGVYLFEHRSSPHARRVAVHVGP